MTPLYKDASQPISLRVADLLERMTVAEKLAQLHGLWLVLSADGKHQLRDDAFVGQGDTGWSERLRHGLGQITRPMGTHSVTPRQGVQALNALQHYLVEQTRLGIPALAHEECLVGVMCSGATLFPSALNHGACWQPELVERAAQAIGNEARSLGCRQGLAPVLDVSRDVRWGRTEETFGEDPYLVGVLGTRFVRGLQGPQRDLLATLKHFAGHSFSEGARNHAPVHVGPCEFNDIFLLPFEMAVKQAHAGSVMPAYHDLDGQPCHSDRSLLHNTLREQWGFDGLVVADYAGISLLFQNHGVAQNAEQAALQAIAAGVDVELPGDECVSCLDAAVADGRLPMATLDTIVQRLLSEKFRLGLFEQPFVDEQRICLQQPDTIALTRNLAAQSIVLLENRGVLPLSPTTKTTMAVIGATADDPLAHLCGYSFPVHLILNNENEVASQVITPLNALQAQFGAQIRYAKGCEILAQRQPGAPTFPGDVDDATSLQQQSPVAMDTSLIGEAVYCAEQSDIALVFVGDLAGLFQSGTVGEGSDTDTLQLPGVQQQLLAAVVATGIPTVVVMSGGRPYSLGGLEDKVAAWLMIFSAGQQVGPALVDVLTGAVNPSGRLPLSLPKSAGAMPYFYNHKFKSSGTPVAFHFGSRYPFGFGRSYTDFSYCALDIVTPEVALDGEIVVEVTLENCGQYDGAEVVQLYVHDLLASRVRPVKELKAFNKVHLATGQRAFVRFTIPVDMLNFTDQPGRRVVEPGQFEIMVGASSASLPLQGLVTVTGQQRRVLPSRWRMESHCDIRYDDQTE